MHYGDDVYCAHMSANNEQNLVFGGAVSTKKLS